MPKAKQLSDALACGHCGNVAQMEVVREYSQVRPFEDPQTGYPWEAGHVYALLVCPACEGIVLQQYYWMDHYEPEDVSPQVIYPCAVDLPGGLPDEVRGVFEDALKTQRVDANAFAVALGRLLEAVCDDCGAKKGKLRTRLKDLARLKGIPEKVVDLAERLVAFRDVGAHAGVGGLTKYEVPILNGLCREILGYVYGVPHLDAKAALRLKGLRTRERSKKGREGDGVGDDGS